MKKRGIDFTSRGDQTISTHTYLLLQLPIYKRQTSSPLPASRGAARDKSFGREQHLSGPDPLLDTHNGITVPLPYILSATNSTPLLHCCVQPIKYI